MSFHTFRDLQPIWNKPVSPAVTPKTYNFGYILE